MGRSLNYGRAYGSQYASWVTRGARRYPNVNSFRAIPTAEALATRVKLARLKREAAERRT